MKYSILCQIYEELETHSSRLEKTEILSTFLKKLKKEDKEIIYLLQGRIFPDYDEREMGISNQLAVKALSKSTGSSKSEIEKLWKKLGDLGLVAEQITEKKKQSTLSSKDISTEKVLKNLQKLPELEGKGTIEKKLALIAELLTASSPKEAKYLIRTLLGDLRIGTGAGTIRDAIVWACFDKEDKEAYELVQDSFDKTTDWKLVFEASCKGKKELKKTELTPGQAVKVMLYPKVSNIEEAFERAGKPSAFEYKYDGFRCISGYTKLYVKNRGILSVRHIKKGDSVLTHKGKFRKISAVNIRKINKKERLFEIQSFYGDRFKISQGHPVLVYRNKAQWINIELLKKDDKLIFPVPKIDAEFPYKKEIKFEDESGYTKKVKINDFLFRFLGYWIGDGFTNEYHNTERVGLIFNKKNKELCEYYKSNIKKYFNIKNISENTHNGAIYLYWRDKPLRIWLSKHFRREWKGKKLPDWFFGINETQFKNFLKGWIESDGHTDNFGRTNISTKERDLAMFASLLGLKFQRMIGVKIVCINKKEYYKLVLPKSKRSYRLLNKNFYLLDIKKINEIKYPHPMTNLYNLQVENDESYCVPMMTLHNCMINKDKEGKIKIFTRRLDNVSKQFPDVVKYVKDNIRGKSFIIDAEAVGYDPETKVYRPFQEISQRIKRKYDIKKLEKELPVEVIIFDIIYYEGESYIKVPFQERRKLLKKIVKQEKHKTILAEQIITDKEKEAQKFFEKAIKEGQEGLMVKKLDAPYKPGSRIGYGYKLKPEDRDFDLVITEAEYGTGKRAGWLTSYSVSCKSDNKFLEVGKVSTGLKEKDEEGLSFNKMTKILKPLIEKEQGRKVKVKPKVVVAVTYQNIQKSPTYTSGYALRFPRITRLRPDRNTLDIATKKEIEKEYERH